MSMKSIFFIICLEFITLRLFPQQIRNDCRCNNYTLLAIAHDTFSSYDIYVFGLKQDTIFIYVDSNQYSSPESNVSYKTMDIIVGHSYYLCTQIATCIPRIKNEGCLISMANHCRYNEFSGIIYTTNDIQNRKIIVRKKLKRRPISHREPIRILHEPYYCPTRAC